MAFFNILSHLPENISRNLVGKKGDIFRGLKCVCAFWCSHCMVIYILARIWTNRGIQELFLLLSLTLEESAKLGAVPAATGHSCLSNTIKDCVSAFGCEGFNRTMNYAA